MISRRERKKRETHQRLMEAALDLFRERGYDATTVEDITDAADVAKGTFFNYFATKEDILPALAEWRLRQLGDALLPEQGAPDSPVARIKMALCLVAEDPLANPSLARRLFAAVMPHLDNLDSEDAHPGRALARLLADQVRQAQGVGEIRDDLDPLYVGGLIRTAFFQQLMVWYCGYSQGTLPDLLDRTVDLLLDGIAGPEWGRAS